MQRKRHLLVQFLSKKRTNIGDFPGFLSKKRTNIGYESFFDGQNEGGFVF